MASESPTVSARLRAEIAARRLQADAGQSAAALRLDALASELGARPPSLLQKLRSRLAWSPVRAPRGVYLCGGVGRGKTLLMDFFVTSLEDAAPGSVQRSHFYHFMRDVHAELASVKQRAEPLERVAERLLARARVLCLDEFFVSDIGDAMILAGLMKALFRRGATLVATSNVRPQDLYQNGLQRSRFLPAIERIASHVDVLQLDGAVDYRLRQLETAPTYLDSNRPETAAALRERFTALTGGSACGPTTLRIEGRALPAVDASPDAAWFRFAELCEGPRSQNDYIDLARVYHTIFIEAVPLFDAAAENAARRFIMLIDELYDRGVKTVISAAAAPGALYRGERLQFEFQRAASRLVEMQTQEYLAGQHRP